MMGTSFGGLGNKIALVWIFPDEDVILFKNELHKIREFLNKDENTIRY